LQLIKASGVTIYPIAVTAGFAPGSSRALRSKSVLEQMAELTGGQVFTPRTSKDLSGIYAKILQELQSQYPRPASVGLFRALTQRLLKRRPPPAVSLPAGCQA
jgi:hypothetical protein